MTLIEFFDINDIENIAGTLLCAPRRTIFIGENKKAMDSAAASYDKILKNRKIATKIYTKAVNRSNLKSIVEVLSELALENENCVIDLTGGDEMYLTAAGIVYERYPDKVMLHRFNIRNGMLYQCDCDGNKLKAGPAAITVSENITIYGGKTVSAGKMEPSFAADVFSLWNVFCGNSDYWNAQVNTLSAITCCFIQKNELSFNINKQEVKDALQKRGVKFICFTPIFRELQNRGLIKKLQNDNYTLAFEFKNKLIKNCLTKAGLLLELFIAFSAKTAVDKNGNPIYDDVMTGVVIDWDGVFSQSSPEVENEVDVLFTKSLVPVFVSCKNGSVDINELYKLSTVASRFGGKYAKKVLVTTELDTTGTKGKYLLLRAEEMKITLIEKIDKIPAEKIQKILSNLWQN